MNKKLLVVLVVVTAILVTGAWVLAAKRSPTGTVAIKQAPEDLKGVERPAMAPTLPKLSHQQSATSMPEAPAIQKQPAIVEATGHPQKGAISQTLLSGTPVRLGAPSGKDECILAGTPAWFVGDWIYGLEWYANYQDPEEFGCTAVWPFQVTEIDFQLNFPPEWVEAPVYVQGWVFDDIGTPTCPVPEATPGFHEPCSTAVYGYLIPTGGGYFELPMPMTEECCVYGPYFAVVYIWTDLYGLNVDMVSEGNATATCRSYNDYGTGWIDLVLSAGFPGPLMLYTQGYTSPQNDCPTEGDTCGVQSITPSTISLLAGGTATYTANVYFVGAQTSCFLTVTPDPACPSCVTTITPNPVLSTAPSATITIVTDPSTPPGTYTFDVNGAKASATLIVVAPDDSCVLQRYIETTGYRFDGWSAGDQSALLLDPASCISCGGDLYPFHIQQVTTRWANPAAATALDVIFHIYEAGVACDGPGVEIYQFPATITAWSPTYVTVPLPDIICVDGPFWISAEYVATTPPAIVFPSLRMTSQTYADTCTQFNYYGGFWYEWADFWAPPLPGYYCMGVIGQCEGDQCPIECNLIQDQGAPASYFGGFSAGDAIAKYFDPAVYCEEPVYPYKIHDVEFLLYNPWGTPSVDIIIDVHMVCHDSCDGPGTEIYKSDPITVTTFYPSMVHLDLPKQICVYEPFFLSLEYASGLAGSTPSFMFDDDIFPCDTCHAWLFYDGYSPPWWEWSDFWGPPIPGCPIIRVTGFTNHFDCLQEPCDTVINVLADYGTPTWLWSLPSTSGRNYPNQRFNLPSDFGGRLDSVGFMFYGATGDPNPTIYIWTTDGAGHPWDNNPPYQALAEFQIPTASIQPFPTLTWVSTWQRGLKFDPEAEFFAGYSFAFDAGDALSLVSDDYEDPLNTSTRAGFYWPPPDNMWLNVYESYGIYMSFVVKAAICVEAPPNPTFTLNVTPTPLYVTPGDPPVHYTAEVGQVLGYSQPVTLDLADVSPSPAPGTITAIFTPNGQPCPYSSDVAVTADAMVPYGIYALTIRGTGAKDIVKTKIVNLIVQPPYDEGIVHFNHGIQRSSNFGLIGHADIEPNFTWYGFDPLYAGTIVSAMTWSVYDEQEEHMHLVYGGCDYPFTPTQHMTIDSNNTYGEVAYSHFFTEESRIPGEYDSLFIIGLKKAECTDFSIKIKIYYNPTANDIPELWTALFEDWDVSSGGTADWGDMDTLHNLMWMYDNGNPTDVFGAMRVPFDDYGVNSMVFLYHQQEVYPTTADSCWQCGDATPPQPGGKYLFKLMSQPGYRAMGYWGESADDHSMLITSPPFSLNPGEKHIEIWIDYGFAGDFSDPLVRKAWWHRVLRYAGFYRGDLNADDRIDVRDVVYLINYVLIDGPAPKPYPDQGDVNADGVVDVPQVEVTDLVYLINYLFKEGPPPIDYVRFIPQFWSRPSLFENDNWK